MINPIINPITKGMIGISGILIFSNIIEKSMKKFDTNVQPPIDKVSVIIPSYNEEPFIETAILSIMDQSIIHSYPNYFELILADSNSTDKTVEIARNYIDNILITPRGKLTARNIAIRQSKGNIIVSADADCYYPYHWLNTLLKPFCLGQNVIAISGSTIDYSIPKIPKFARNIAENFEKTIHPTRLLGRNSAFYKHAFYLIGGFNEKINQFNIEEMLNEEEIGFGLRLSQIGKVITKMNASCIHLGGQKIGCRLNPKEEICKKYGIGKDRF